ncbi:MAG: response regulator transcription factor [Arenicellales bacterium WSBS_2016_MAG_OTU3]
MQKIIAIVEDDPDQRDNYSDALITYGYQVETFSSKPEALECFHKRLPDLAILDIMLNDEMDGGFDICRELRMLSPNLPIIFLTARDSDIDRVSGLRLDAWDYLTKPVNLQFLAVRVNSLFRIAQAIKQQSAGAAKNNQLQIGDLLLDSDSMSIKWQGQDMNMTLTEFWIVEALAHVPGIVKTYADLMQVTRQSYVEKNTINGYVRRIRKKFKELDGDFSNIKTVFGIGYRWQAGEQS